MLTVDQVVDIAIALADDVGLEGMSMPTLASRLEVGTMTLYGYVANKQQLLDLMAARVFEGLEMPDIDDWRQQLWTYFHRFRQVALAHPSSARLLADGRVTIPAVFDTLERALRTMHNSGLTPEHAVRTFYAALTYTIGFVLWEIPRTHLQSEADYHAQWRDLTAGLDPGSYPTLTGVASNVTPTTASIEQFRWGLARILSIE
ncbi:MAG: TetR family transcriptional regulator [Gammaproteobacteria bacterium]|nr:TetR family transcriptional regulator [Gammaproteobacteria bacterium]